MSEPTMTPTDHMRAIWMALSDKALLFRNNVAKAVVGNVTWIHKRQQVWVDKGDAVVRGARFFHAGLENGSGDLIGGTAVEIKPEHVGMTLLVFTSVEVKQGTGRTETEQEKFAGIITKNGGIAGTVKNSDEGLALLSSLDR